MLAKEVKLKLDQALSLFNHPDKQNCYVLDYKQLANCMTICMNSAINESADNADSENLTKLTDFLRSYVKRLDEEMTRSFEALTGAELDENAYLENLQVIVGHIQELDMIQAEYASLYPFFKKVHHDWIEGSYPLGKIPSYIEIMHDELLGLEFRRDLKVILFKQHRFMHLRRLDRYLIHYRFRNLCLDYQLATQRVIASFKSEVNSAIDSWDIKECHAKFMMLASSDSGKEIITEALSRINKKFLNLINDLSISIMLLSPQDGISCYRSVIDNIKKLEAVREISDYVPASRYAEWQSNLQTIDKLLQDSFVEAATTIKLQMQCYHFVEAEQAILLFERIAKLLNWLNMDFPLQALINDLRLHSKEILEAVLKNIQEAELKDLPFLITGELCKNLNQAIKIDSRYGEIYGLINKMIERRVDNFIASLPFSTLPQTWDKADRLLNLLAKFLPDALAIRIEQQRIELIEYKNKVLKDAWHPLASGVFMPGSQARFNSHDVQESSKQV